MKIVTFGEIMMRLAPFRNERFSQANTLEMTFGGGEANVAVSLAHYGHDVSFVSKLPANPLGDMALETLRRYGVKTDFVQRGGTRLGIYFLEHGASIRPSRVTYDRAHSAIAEAEPGSFDWDVIFAGKDWFHITGITPAVSEKCAALSLEAVERAKKLGLNVSCDLNYRKKLWSREEARKTMSRLVEWVDVIIANEEDAADVFAIKAADTDITEGKLSVTGYQAVARRLHEHCQADLVAITLRESISASDNNWSALLYDGSNTLTSRKYPIHLVDRVGGGDSFAAGLIHGLTHAWDVQKCLDFAVAASALKQTIQGDFNLVAEKEVLSVMGGDISGRVQR